MEYCFESSDDSFDGSEHDEPDLIYLKESLIDECEENSVLEGFDNSLLDKNGKLWSVVKPSKTKTPAENILNFPQVVTSYTTQRVDNLVDCFKHFFPLKIIQKTIEFSNLHGKNHFGDKWKELDVDEMYDFISCILYMAIHKDRQEPISELFSSDEGRQIYRDLFSLQRFRQLTRSLHFDDISTREDRRLLNKFCPIRELWDIWVDVMGKSYNPGPNVCLDEQLVSFRGNCSFRQYIKSKPAKYGLKFFLLVDAQSSFILNIDAYVWEKCSTDKRVHDVGKNIALKLTTNLVGSGCNLVCDNYFTSVPLAEELLQRKMTLLGTIRKNKRDIPPFLFPKKNSLLNESKFIYDGKKMLLSFLERKNQPVILLCTSNNNTNVSKDFPYKPEVILQYNASKGGVDTVDRMLASVSVRRFSRRWPLIVFYNMIDISLINAFVVYKEIFNNPTVLKRNFLKKIAFELSVPLRNRNCVPRSALAIKLKDTVVPCKRKNIKENATRKRCTVCKRNDDNKTYLSCDLCMTPCCRRHLTYVCKNCLQ